MAGNQKLNPTYIILFLLLFAASFLLFFNLGHDYLWQDEAQTALISQTIWERGVPLGHDGTHSFSQEAGKDMSETFVWRWHNWLPFYILGIFFKLFGVSTFVARLPFALMGLASVIAAFFLGKKLFKKESAGLYAAALITFSVPFLLLAKQCKYHSPTILFSLLGFLFYLQYIEGRKKALWFFAGAALLLFHSHFIYTVTLCGAVCLHVLIFERKKFIPVFLVSAGIGVINIPWMLWFFGNEYSGSYGGFDSERISMFTEKFSEMISQHIFPPLLFLVPVIILLWNKMKEKQFLPNPKGALSPVVLMASFILFNLVIFIVATPYPFFRYLAPLIPAALLLVGGMASGLNKIHFSVGAALVVLLIVFNPLKKYVTYITRNFNGPVEGIVKFLDQNAAPGQTVAITYGDLPLKFYHPDLKIYGGLTGEDLSQIQHPDWIIVRKYVISDKDAKVRQHLINNIPWNQYERIVINYPDTPFQNRESPKDHLYKTKRSEEKVAIFRKR